jgi:hypothetical protein
MRAGNILYGFGLFLLLLSCADAANRKGSKKIQNINQYRELDTSGEVLGWDSAFVNKCQIEYERNGISQLLSVYQHELNLAPLSTDTSSVSYRFIESYGWFNPYGGTPMAITVSKCGNVCRVKIIDKGYKTFSYSENDSVTPEKFIQTRELPISEMEFEKFAETLEELGIYEKMSADWMGGMKIYDNNKCLVEFNDGENYKLLFRQHETDAIYKMKLEFYKISLYNVNAIQEMEQQLADEENRK